MAITASRIVFVAMVGLMVFARHLGYTRQWQEEQHDVVMGDKGSRRVQLLLRHTTNSSSSGGEFQEELERLEERHQQEKEQREAYLERKVQELVANNTALRKKNDEATHKLEQLEAQLAVARAVGEQRAKSLENTISKSSSSSSSANKAEEEEEKPKTKVEEEEKKENNVNVAKEEETRSAGKQASVPDNNNNRKPSEDNNVQKKEDKAEEKNGVQVPAEEEEKKESNNIDVAQKEDTRGPDNNNNNNNNNNSSMKPNKEDDKVQKQNKDELTTTTTAKEDVDIHHWSQSILELQPWEIDTLAKPFQESCKTPEGTPNFCCLNSPSHLLKDKLSEFQTMRNKCNHVTQDDHQWMQQQAQQELDRMVEEDDSHSREQCDVCGVVEVLRRHNFTFAFFGDSLTSQSSNAFACELQRRNYNVTYESQSKRGGDGYRNFREIRRMTISSPTWKDDAKEVNHVVIDFIFQYRLPSIIPEQQAIIATQYDVLVLNFGHHWVYQPGTKSGHKFERTHYNKKTLGKALAGLFNAIHDGGRAKMVAWRENSASHFDADGGDYSLARGNEFSGNNTCVPYRDDTSNTTSKEEEGPVHAWRERVFRESVAQKTNYTLVTAGRQMPPLMPSSAESAKKKKKNTNSSSSELVVLPFYDFSSKAHGFHKVSPKSPDCTHFCYTPFLYLPIWRGLRLSLERAFPLEDSS